MKKLVTTIAVAGALTLAGMSGATADPHPNPHPSPVWPEDSWPRVANDRAGKPAVKCDLDGKHAKTNYAGRWRYWTCSHWAIGWVWG